MNDGGPAFPVNLQGLPNGGTVWPELGMSSRRYLAAKALQGLLASNVHNIPTVVCKAYEIADAMLAFEQNGN